MSAVQDILQNIEFLYKMKCFTRSLSNYVLIIFCVAPTCFFSFLSRNFLSTFGFIDALRCMFIFFKVTDID